MVKGNPIAGWYKGVVMINEFQLKNFKAWEDTGPIKLKPLTVIFGGNSSGKSSIGHFLMALKQTVLLTDRKRALHLGAEHSLIDLGTYEECVHGHDLPADMSFRIQWGKHKPFAVEDVLKKHDRYQGPLSVPPAAIHPSALPLLSFPVLLWQQSDLCTVKALALTAFTLFISGRFHGPGSPRRPGGHGGAVPGRLWERFEA